MFSSAMQPLGLLLLMGEREISLISFNAFNIQCLVTVSLMDLDDDNPLL